ncbi:MAG: hypothetical protein KDC98_22405, partial [Planctomycetes bacterium]|nr:hypothetical protein [Planctomycetota bacterium]
MSSKRHGLPRKRPTNKRQKAIDEELPVLEPVAEATAEAVNDGPVKVACEASDEDGFDTVLSIEVPAMEKKAVADAITGPLQRAAQLHRAAMRFRSVVVRFAGEALIGSAIKELVAEQLSVAKPVKVVVRRGYGDEVVFESEPPQLAVDLNRDGVTMTVTVGTGDLEASDLAGLFEPLLGDIAGQAAGKKFAFEFTGNAKPDRDLRSHIEATLRAAEAVRVAIGARVLFDRELTDRCRVSDLGDDVLVTIDPAADPATTGEAMETVLPDHALGFAGKAVRVRWQKPPQHGEGDHLLRIIAGFAPEHVEFEVAGGEPAVVWPSVLEVVPGAEVTLRVRPHGRDHSAVLAAFPVELAELEGELRDRAVVVDWPSLFVVDDDTERCLVDAMSKVGPKSVCCTVAGNDREPFVPAPVTLADEGDLAVVGVDTDAGRPADLVRAVSRRVPRFAEHLGGKTVRVRIAGAAPASRTLLRSVLDLVVVAGPVRLEVEDHGPVDVMLPPMLRVQRSSETAARIEVDLGGRDEGQRSVALKREFEAAALPKGAIVTLVASPLDDQLLAALIEHHAESVTRDDGTQLYPEELPEPEPEPEPEMELMPEPTASPAPAPAAPPTDTSVAPVAVTSGSAAICVLALNNEAVPPTVMLGVAAGVDAAHLAAVEQELTAHLPRLSRRAVMVVLQQNGVDAPVRKPDAMVEMLRRVLPTTAAATLIFRGPDAQDRPHFQVLHSTLRALPIGATFFDPRA